METTPKAMEIEYIRIKRLNQGREKAYATGTNVICCYYGSRKIEPFKNSCQLFSKKLGKQVEGMAPEFLKALKAADWRGNIRELRNVIERSMIVCDKQLTLQDLPIEIQNARQEDYSGKNYSEFELAAMEKRHIAKVLQHTKGNKTEASRLLKIGLTTLYRKIEEYGI